MFVARSKIDNSIVGPFDSREDFLTFLSDLGRLLEDDDVARDPIVWDVQEVEHYSDPHDWPGTVTKTVTFGLGRHQDMALFLYRDGSVKIAGMTYVACGNGGNHYPELDENIDAPAWASYVLQAQAAVRESGRPIGQRGVEEIQYEAMAMIVDEALAETWVDPCESEPEFDDDAVGIPAEWLETSPGVFKDAEGNTL